jgi:HD domain
VVDTALPSEGESTLDMVSALALTPINDAKSDSPMRVFESSLWLIWDAEIREFIATVLAGAPQYFWTVPSSTSGKTHPPDERGEGGRVLHTKRVVRLVSEYGDLFDLNRTDKDVLIAAALIHDIIVNGTTNEPLPYMWRSHDVELREYLTTWRHLEGDPRREKIVLACEGHMGRFGSTPKNAPTPGTLGYILHVADATAALSFVKIDPIG